MALKKPKAAAKAAPENEKQAALERIARDLAEVRDQAERAGEELLTFLVTLAWQEAASRLLK